MTYYERNLPHWFPVVMANRTHLLIDPIAPLSQVTNGVKGASTRDANRILGRVGKRFWQDETFDH